MQNLSIRTKLALSFIFVLVAALVQGIFAIQRLSAVNDVATEINQNWLPSAVVSGRLMANIAEFRIKEARHVISTTDAAMAQVEKELATLRTAIEQDRQRYDKLVSSDLERKTFGEVQATWSKYLEQHTMMLELSRANRNEEAYKLFAEKSKDAYYDLRKDLETLVDLNVKGGADAGQHGQELYDASRTTILVAIAVTIGFTIFIGFVLAGSIANPTIAMTNVMGRLASQDYSVTIPALGRKDEIGRMADAVQVFKQTGQDMVRLQEEQNQARDRARVEKRQAMEQLADTFESSVKGVVDSVASAATEMRATSTSLSAVASQASQQAVTVSAAAEQASSNVQTVAAAAEELAASIGEIGRQVAQASQMAQSAVDQANRTDGIVRELNSAAQRIGEVVRLIDDIASQTNLLALNATIEAARAGEAGKGFAVVANEVKNLANQTARATGEISQQIVDVQAVTTGTVNAIQDIARSIASISQVSANIASAVEEQAAATQEIARNVQQAAAGTADVTSNIAGVQQAANDAGDGSQQVLTSSSQLAQQAETLRREVDAFINKVRTA